MLQQRCERPWFDAKVFGINAPKSFKYIFFPTARSRQQQACYYYVPQKFKPFALFAQNLFELIFPSIARGFLFRFLLSNHDLKKFVAYACKKSLSVCTNQIKKMNVEMTLTKWMQDVFLLYKNAKSCSTRFNNY